MELSPDPPAGPHPAGLTDEQLVQRVQQSGDRRAFGLIARRWREPIRRLCARMTGDAESAEDLAQEALARLLAHAGDYRQKARLGTYLRRIALNLCFDEGRRSRRRPGSLSEGEALEAPGPLPAARAARRERAALVKAALDRLPEHYRAVVVLRHYEDLKFREIAEVLDIPQGTVKSRMAEALSRLARMLAPLKQEHGQE
jgi:RNA polymerase sigma-70 factor (ECF subfamily)